MSENPGPTERRYQGVGVSPGIAHGTVAIRAREEDEVVIYSIEESEIPAEILRFEAALLATRSQIMEMQRQIAGAIGSRDAGIFDAHLLVVEDRTLIDEVLRNLERDKQNIEAVFQKVANRYAHTLSQIDDPYLKERALDIHDVSRRVIQNLLGKSPRTAEPGDAPHIIVAHNITPSDTAAMNRSLVLGFATDVGSKTSHTAIMANSLKIPAVVGLHNASVEMQTGEYALLDGYTGMLIVNPTEQTLWEYGQIEFRKEKVERELTELRDTASTTRDGHHVMLSANIELPEDLDAVQANGAEGIGLYRTEFFYLNSDTPPGEDEQYENYRHIAQRSLPHGVIIRTLDIGGDKVLAEAGDFEEANPFLGWRAIRFCLETPDVFKAQLRAILRASETGNVKLMFPMISGVEELHQAKALLEECRQELRAEGRAFDEKMEIGAMIEVPSAAIVADVLAKEVDFFSIGTNDLIQYSIAVDRLNERISSLYQPTHLAILRLIKWTVESAHKENVWVGVCGEMAGDVLFTPLLIGLGVDKLSVGAALVPRVKRAIQALDREECVRVASDICTLGTHGDIARRCEEIARTHYPELFE